MSLAALLLASLSTTILIASQPLADEPHPEVEPESTPPAQFGMEVHTTDNSVIKLKILNPVLEFSTSYGDLKIPIEDILRIEFATRISAQDKAQATQAIDDLGSPNFRVREKASKTLLALAHKAYPDLLTASKSSSLEVATRARKLIGEIRTSVRPELLEVREHDIITTKDSKIAGRLTVESIDVETAQFGNQSLKLTDVLTARSQAFKEEEPKEVMADPGRLSGLRDQIDKVFHFRVTGAVGGSVWGSGTYTTDSSLATAAVHAGVLKVGETGVVRVRIVATPNAFQGSTQNGVTTYDYGVYPGAYQIEANP